MSNLHSFLNDFWKINCKMNTECKSLDFTFNFETRVSTVVTLASQRCHKLQAEKKKTSKTMRRESCLCSTHTNAVHPCL